MSSVMHGRAFGSAGSMTNKNVTYTSDNNVYVLDNNDFNGNFMNIPHAHHNGCVVLGSHSFHLPLSL